MSGANASPRVKPANEERSYAGLEDLVTRPIVPAPTRMSVYRLLEGIRVFLQPVAQLKGIRIVTDCDPDCFAVADDEVLHRMLPDLVFNALREIPTDGSVSLKGQVAGRDFLIEVEDTGTGIQEECLARIFDPMLSTSREGCGLGLPIVRRIVESPNGMIHVSSSRKGTRFLKAKPHNGERGERKPERAKPHNMEVVRESVTCSR